MVRDRRGGSRGRAKAMVAGASAIGLATLTALPAQASTNPVYDKEWALSQFNVTAIRSQYNARGADVIVAVVDSGVDSTQPDLQGSLVGGINTTNPADPTADTGDTSNEYHGTSVSAIIAAHAHGDANNPQGMYGLATQAKVMPIKDGSNGATSAATAAGIKWAVDHGARVINVSEGSTSPASNVTDAINYALTKNVVVVVATGNDAGPGGNNAANGYATVPGVIDVSAIDQAGHMDQYSHTGSDVTVAAPGVSIEVPYPDNSHYSTRSGSSLAAPWVSGEAALIIGLHPDWTAGQVVRVIIGNTVQGSGARIDDRVGYGVIDPLKALGAAAPNDTSNPLGGPTVTASSTTVGATGGSSPASTTTASSSKKSSNIGLYAGLGVGVLVLIGVIVFLITRGKNNNGSGGGGGGGGGNGYYPPTSGPGGQYAQPPQSQQYPASSPSQPYQSAQYPQSPYSQPQSQPQQQYPAPPQGYGQPGQPPPQEETPWPQQ